MYKIVFGMTNLKGLAANDFKFIPAQSVPKARRASMDAVPSSAVDTADAAAAEDCKPLNGCVRGWLPVCVCLWRQQWC